MGIARWTGARRPGALLVPVALAAFLVAHPAGAAPEAYRFHRVAVIGDVDGAELQERVENLIIRHLGERGFDAVRIGTVLPPARDATGPEADSAFFAHGVDAVLIVMAGPHRQVRPERRWIAACEAAWPWANFRAILIEVQHRETAFTATATGEPDRIRKSIPSLCDKAVQLLVQSRVLATRAQLDAARADTGSAGTAARDALYIVNLERGRQIRARRLALTANGILHAVDTTGKDIYLSANKVRSIIDRLGADRTYRVMEEGKSLP